MCMCVFMVQRASALTIKRIVLRSLVEDLAASQRLRPTFELNHFTG